jgi:hypothetical protein
MIAGTAINLSRYGAQKPSSTEMNMERNRRPTHDRNSDPQLFDWLALALACITVLAIVADARTATITP